MAPQITRSSTPNFIKSTRRMVGTPVPVESVSVEASSSRGQEALQSTSRDLAEKSSTRRISTDINDNLSGLCPPRINFHEDSKELEPNSSNRPLHTGGKKIFVYPPDGGCLPHIKKRLYGLYTLLGETHIEKKKRLLREAKYRNTNKLRDLENKVSTNMERTTSTGSGSSTQLSAFDFSVLCTPKPNFHEPSKKLDPNSHCRRIRPGGKKQLEYPPEGGCLPHVPHRLYGHRLLLGETQEEKEKRLRKENHFRMVNKQYALEIMLLLNDEIRSTASTTSTPLQAPPTRAAKQSSESSSQTYATGLCVPVSGFHEASMELDPNSPSHFPSTGGNKPLVYPPEGGCLPNICIRLYGHRLLLGETKADQKKRLEREKKYRTSNARAIAMPAPVPVPGPTCEESLSLCSPITGFHEASKELDPNSHLPNTGRRRLQVYPPEGGCLPHVRFRLYGHRLLLGETGAAQKKRLEREKKYRSTNAKAGGTNKGFTVPAPDTPAPTYEESVRLCSPISPSAGGASTKEQQPTFDRPKRTRKRPRRS